MQEETGVTCSDVTYHSSQPWPFPHSLMLGFFARADRSQPIVIHAEEMAEANWYSREDLKNGVVTLPPSNAISNVLIR